MTASRLFYTDVKHVLDLKGFYRADTFVSTTYILIKCKILKSFNSAIFVAALKNAQVSIIIT